MAELPPRKRVEDVALMRALAHPLRTALLDYLGAAGPRTASECAAAVDSSASNCSWHLRQLARFGLVRRSETGEAADGRERPWQATEVGIELGEFAVDPATQGAQLAAAAAMLGQEQQLTQRFLDTMAEQDPRWRDAAAFSGYALRITAEELRELVAAVDALVRPYVAPIRTDPPPDARPVHLGMRAFLRVEADGTVSA